jgi:N,N'-diacetyllegionaminate synthase
MFEIIAEIGQNHNGDMGLARELIHAAKENGADAAKFQLYDAVALFPKKNNPWYEYNCQTELSQDQVLELNDECHKVGIEFMSSVFDVGRIKWLEDVGVKTHKIASRSIKDDQLVEALCTTGKRLLVSLGMWDNLEFPQISSKGKIEFLYCISKYPTPLADVKLDKVNFGRYAGFSDHTIGITACCAALARGARIIEKHFTLDISAYGPDHSGSMIPDELAALDKFRRELSECL